VTWPARNGRAVAHATLIGRVISIVAMPEPSWENRSESARPVDVRLLSSEASADTRLVGELVGLINRVYVVAEAGLWVDGATRTITAQMEQFVRSGQIAVAAVAGQVAGCIRVHDLDANSAEFGMLAAAAEHRGIGVGRELVRFAEERSRGRGRGIMRLELLMPRNWVHPSKVFLENWYGRLGYRAVRVGRIEDAYPELGPLLATPCKLVIFEKRLV
jgi:GNAT superfamily N-acetyltransferase